MVHYSLFNDLGSILRNARLYLKVMLRSSMRQPSGDQRQDVGEVPNEERNKKWKQKRKELFGV